MAYCHRDGDLRACGATTVVVGQSFVTVNGKLWAVAGDINSHGDGQLINSQSYITINNKYVILQGDHANPDDLAPDILDGGLTPHDDPIATGYDSLIQVS